MKFENLNLDQVKDFLKNTRWSNETLSYIFKNEMLQVSDKPEDKYDIVEDGEEKRYINFKGELILIEDLDEKSLKLNDKGSLFTLQKD